MKSLFGVLLFALLSGCGMYDNAYGTLLLIIVGFFGVLEYWPWILIVIVVLIVAAVGTISWLRQRT